MQRTSFAGKVLSRLFGVQHDGGCRFGVTLAPMLEDLHARLSSVIIECLPYANFLQRYDSNKTLFYLDPPYYGHESCYGKGLFGRNDFTIIRDLLGDLQGRFILSINDVPEIRKLYGDFNVKPVKTIYTASSKKCKKVGELLISN